MVSSVDIHRGFPLDRRDEVVDVLRAYAGSLGVDLSFQGFEAELQELPGSYVPPKGAFLWAEMHERVVGVVALRPLDVVARVCEMKRLFVLPIARGHGVGRRLAVGVIEEARRIGYGAIRLDTLPMMAQAQALYHALGFREIAPYTHNPIAGTRFMELTLEPGADIGR